MAKKVAEGSKGAIRIYDWANEEDEHTILRGFKGFFAGFWILYWKFGLKYGIIYDVFQFFNPKRGKL